MSVIKAHEAYSCKSDNVLFVLEYYTSNKG